MSLIQSNSINGDVLYFNDEEHCYTLNGKPAPGVTTVNSGGMPKAHFLIAWMIKEGSKFTVAQLKQFPEPVSKLPSYLVDEILKKSTQAYKRKAKEAANVGSIIHDYCEQMESTGEIETRVKDQIEASPDRDKIDNCIKNFNEWRETNHDVIQGHEEIVGSAKHHFAGKYDSLRRRGDKLILSDYKTSNGIYTEYLIQLGAYALALEEWKGIKVDGIEIVRFGKMDASFEVKTITRKSHIKEFKEQFLHNIGTYRFMQKWS